MNLFKNINKTLDLIESFEAFIDDSLNNAEVYELLNEHFGKKYETKSVSLACEICRIIYYNKNTGKVKEVFVSKYNIKNSKLHKLVWVDIWNKVSFIYNIKIMITRKLDDFTDKYIKKEIDKILNINDAYVHFMIEKHYDGKKWINGLYMFFRNKEEEKCSNRITFLFSETKSVSINYITESEDPIILDEDQVTKLRKLFFNTNFDCDELFLQ